MRNIKRRAGCYASERFDENQNVSHKVDRVCRDTRSEDLLLLVDGCMGPVDGTDESTGDSMEGWREGCMAG